MNRWKRLFVVIGVCWAIVSPLLVAGEANRGPELAFHGCSDSAYQQYGSSDSPKFDINRYIAEMDACTRVHARDHVGLARLIRAMAGGGDKILGLAGWGLLLIPFALLWIISWAIGHFAIWAAAGFHRWMRHRKGAMAH